MSIEKTRRSFVRAALLGGAGLYLFGCPKNKQGTTAPTPTSLAALPEDEGPPAACGQTEDNLEGPYYRWGAPEKNNFITPGLKGTPLLLHGRVYGLDCQAPLTNATLDIWQANGEGHYDNDGSMGRREREDFLLRGKLRTDEKGRFVLRTIIPGHYLDGAQYRPAHIHAKVTAPGYFNLTTQLYFEGDPYNQIDPYIKPSLIMPLSDHSDGGRAARFDFILRPT